MARAKKSVAKTSTQFYRELLRSGDIKPMKTSTGTTGDSITLSTPGELTKYVPYVLDDGYVRYSAQFVASHMGDATSSSDWSDGCPYDAAVTLSVKVSDAQSSATASVDHALQIKDTVVLPLEKLRNQERIAKSRGRKSKSK